MAILTIEEGTLQDIADSIRLKTGKSDTMTPLEMPDEIEGLSTISTDYFYIEAIIYACTVEIQNLEYNPHVQLQYSYDKTNWTNYTQTITLQDGQKLYLRNLSDFLTLDTNNPVKINCPRNINVGGRINSLINDIEGKGCHDYAFKNLFENCALFSAANLILNTRVSTGCYSHMFEGCLFLTEPPELPADRLANNCYEYMFKECIALKVPELPATTLAPFCYSHMFERCGLTTPPELPATTLPSNCYDYMFYLCVALEVYENATQTATQEWHIPTNGVFAQVDTDATNKMFQSIHTGGVVATPTFTVGESVTYYVLPLPTPPNNPTN